MCHDEPMETPTHEVEYEQMLLSRHTFLNQRGGRRKNSLMERSAYILLSRIRVQGPMSIGELSDAFGLDASTLNRQTAAMLRSGVVERIADPDGGIARKFRITEEGERRLEADRSFNIGGLERIMEHWPAEDVIRFADFLERFNRDIERLEGRPWPRT